MEAYLVTPNAMRADQARQIPISAYLEQAGITPAASKHGGRELWYSSPLRDGDKTPSFKVDTTKNLWFDHGMARGGNIIDLVIEMRRVTVKDALAILESGFAGSIRTAKVLAASGTAPAGEKKSNVSAARGFVATAERDIEHPALLQYLATRGIALVLARRYVRQVHFRPKGGQKDYFALGFPCGNGFDARSAVFKGFVGDGKSISVLNFTDKGTVAVFEGPYDFLTWLAMRDIEEPDCGVVILHSVSLRRRAITAIREHGFGRVVLYLDHDAAGQETATTIKAEFGDRNVIDRSAGYAGFKDLNERWVARGGGQPTIA